MEEADHRDRQIEEGYIGYNESNRQKDSVVHAFYLSLFLPQHLQEVIPRMTQRSLALSEQTFFESISTPTNHFSGINSRSTYFGGRVINAAELAISSGIIVR